MMRLENTYHMLQLTQEINIGFQQDMDSRTGKESNVSLNEQSLV